MSDIKQLSDVLNTIVEQLLSNDDISDIANDEACDILTEAVEKLTKTLEYEQPTDSDLSLEDLDHIAAIASEFYNSDDEFLMKTADVLDQIMMTIGAPIGSNESFKLAQEEEINKLRQKYTEIAAKNNDKKKELVALNSKEYADAVAKGVKEYRPMEASLSTRTCPDHPGTLVERIAEDTYQCQLDKKIYSYTEGFTTMKGNIVPGTNVSNQSNIENEFFPRTSFETRQDKLNERQ